MDEAYISKSLRRLNRTRFLGNFLGYCSMVLQGILYSALLMVVWFEFFPTSWSLLPLVVGILACFGIWYFLPFRRVATLKEDQLLSYLELTYRDTGRSAFEMKKELVGTEVAEVWDPILELEQRQQWKLLWIKVRNRLMQSGLAGVCLAIILVFDPNALRLSFGTVSNVIAQFNKSTSLTVLEGNVTADAVKEFQISGSSMLELELLERNMVELSVVLGSRSEYPKVELVKQGSDGPTELDMKEVFQSFRLPPKNEEVGGPIHYSLSFAIDDDVYLYIPVLSKMPVAGITLRRQPVPKVRLEAAVPLLNPWPDDRPLPLRITVRSNQPLNLIQLRIVNGQQEYQELVSKVMKDDLKKVTLDHDLMVESFVNQDRDRIEVVAEAVDRSLPQPLAGYSETLVINTISAYGRYLKTLEKVNEVKTSLDELARSEEKQLPESVMEGVSQFMMDSKGSPFFDMMDRLFLDQLEKRFGELDADFDVYKLLEVQQQLTEFLLEHETISDRERDRDFFVAARALSRILEKPRSARSYPAEDQVKNMEDFLEERFRRWELRIQYIPPELKPKSWPEIQQKPFLKGLNQVMDLDRTRPHQDDEKYKILSQTVARYLSWIEELEAAEDQEKERREEERQRRIANAADALKELQRRQSGISKKLDQAVLANQQTMADQWPSVRMEQNANKGKVGEVEAQLRAFSPRAAARIRAAGQEMEKVIAAGQENNFVQAETSTDTASRLLRQAQNQARRDQRRSRQQRDRRRVGNDKYFGQQIGGNIKLKTDYTVDPQFRERILEDVQRNYQDGDQKDQQLLKNYINRVIR